MNWRFRRSDDDKKGADLEKEGSQGREVLGAEKTHDPGVGGRAMLPSEKRRSVFRAPPKACLSLGHPPGVTPPAPPGTRPTVE